MACVHTHTHKHTHTHTEREDREREREKERERGRGREMNVFPITQVLEETTKELQETCDHFLSTLADCMELEEHLRERVVRAVSAYQHSTRSGSCLLEIPLHC